MSELQKAVAEVTARVTAFVRGAAEEHPCCYDPDRVDIVVADLLAPIVDAVRKEGTP